MSVTMDLALYLRGFNYSWGGDQLKLYSDGALGNTDATIFVDDMPDVPDFAVSLLRYEGGPSDQTFGNPLLVRHPRVQVMVRHISSQISLDRCNDILKKLVVVKDQTIEMVSYQRITAVGEPFELGPDSLNRQRAVANFAVSYYDSV